MPAQVSVRGARKGAAWCCCIRHGLSAAAAPLAAAGPRGSLALRAATDGERQARDESRGAQAQAQCNGRRAAPGTTLQTPAGRDLVHDSQQHAAYQGREADRPRQVSVNHGRYQQSVAARCDKTKLNATLQTSSTKSNAERELAVHRLLVQRCCGGSCGRCRVQSAMACTTGSPHCAPRLALPRLASSQTAIRWVRARWGSARREGAACREMRFPVAPHPVGCGARRRLCL